MFLETILIALREIRRNVMRSSLTILGIVIGVAAVITMVTVGDGATRQVANEISSLGSNLIDIYPGQSFRGPGGTRSAAPKFKIADAEAIEREISGLAGVAPVNGRSAQAIRGNDNWSTLITGSTNAYLKVRNWTLADGRPFNDEELRAGSAVCIIGDTLRKQFFGGQDPLGTVIRLEKISCRIIGVLKPKGQSGFGMDQDDFVLLPLRTVQRRLPAIPMSIPFPCRSWTGFQRKRPRRILKGCCASAARSGRMRKTIFMSGTCRKSSKPSPAPPGF